jgi:hypothetical protein
MQAKIFQKDIAGEGSAVFAAAGYNEILLHDSFSSNMFSLLPHRVNIGKSQAA